MRSEIAQYMERLDGKGKLPASKRGRIELPPIMRRAGDIEMLHVVPFENRTAAQFDANRLLVVDEKEPFAVVPASTEGAEVIVVRLIGTQDIEHTPDGRQKTRRLTADAVERVEDPPHTESMAELQDYLRRVGSAGPEVAQENDDLSNAWDAFRADIHDRALAYLDDSGTPWPMTPVCPTAKHMLATALLSADFIDPWAGAPDGQDGTRAADAEITRLKRQGLTTLEAARHVYAVEIKAEVEGSAGNSKRDAEKKRVTTFQNRFDARNGMDRPPDKAIRALTVRSAISDALDRLHEVARYRLAKGLLDDALSIIASTPRGTQRTIAAGRSTYNYGIAIRDVATSLEGDVVTAVAAAVADIKGAGRHTLAQARARKRKTRRP